MHEMRPSSNEVFAERLRNAEARKEQEMEKATRAPRVYSKTKADARKKIETMREDAEVSKQNAEIWELEEA